MTRSTWLLLLTTVMLIAAMPGPAVIFVLANAVDGKPIRGYWAALGITSGGLCYFLLSATGIIALLVASHAAFTIITYAGAAYLIYLGVTTLRGRDLTLVREKPDSHCEHPMHLVRRGFGVTALNPKAMLFVAAVVPQFIRKGVPLAPQMLLIGATSLGTELLILLAYATLAGRAARALQRPDVVKATRRVAGAVLIVVGAAMGVSRFA
jgi:homoserine/homoserine lactone efflux protein